MLIISRDRSRAANDGRRNETVERSLREESFNCVRQRVTCYLEVEGNI